MSNVQTTAMDSLVTAFANPAQSVGPLQPLRPRSRLRAASVALTLSIICHLGPALLVIHHMRSPAIVPELARAPTELLAADFEVLAEPAEPQSPPAQAAKHTAVLANAPRALAQNSGKPRVAPVVPAIPARAASAATAPEPDVMTTAPGSSGLHFTLTVGKTIGSTTKMADPTLASPAGGSAQAPLSSANVDTPAKLRAGNLPAYTGAAIAAGIEANVALEIVVGEAGVVTSARGLDPVGYGLDEAARQSMLGYRFTPALRNGKAVAVRMRWLMRFQLR